jgi:hypothetical protein
MPGILNSQLSLDDFNSTFIYEYGRPAEQFARQKASEKRLLAAGAALWKCTEGSSTHLGRRISPWWCAGNDLDSMLRRCQNMGISLRRYARARLAVIGECNSMGVLLCARLSQPVYAFTGKARWQHSQFFVEGVEGCPRNLGLIEGDAQYFIPHLTPAHIVRVSCTSADHLPRGMIDAVCSAEDACIESGKDVRGA